MNPETFQESSFHRKMKLLLNKYGLFSDKASLGENKLNYSNQSVIKGLWWTYNEILIDFLRHVPGAICSRPIYLQ